MLHDQHLRIKSHGDEESRDARLDGDEDRVADLHADEEGEDHDDRGEVVGGVVGGFGVFEIEVGCERCHVGDEDGAHG